MTTSKARASKRFIALLLLTAVWCAVGFLSKQWDVFRYMVIPVTGIYGAFIVGDSWRPTGWAHPTQPPTSTAA